MFWLVSPQCWSKLLHSSLLSEANVAASADNVEKTSVLPATSLHHHDWYVPRTMACTLHLRQPVLWETCIWHSCNVWYSFLPGKWGRRGEKVGLGGKKPCPHYQASGRRTLLLIGHFCSTGISALYHTISYCTIQCLSGSVCCKTSTAVHGWHRFKRKYFRLQARSSL